MSINRRRQPADPQIIDAIVSAPVRLGWQRVQDVPLVEAIKVHCLIKYLVACPDADLAPSHFRGWLERTHGVIGNFWEQGLHSRKVVHHG